VDQGSTFAKASAVVETMADKSGQQPGAGVPSRTGHRGIVIGNGQLRICGFLLRQGFRRR